MERRQFLAAVLDERSEVAPDAGRDGRAACGGGPSKCPFIMVSNPYGSAGLGHPPAANGRMVRKDEAAGQCLAGSPVQAESG